MLGHPRILFTEVRRRGVLRSWDSSLGYATVLGLDHHVGGLHQGHDPLADVE
jgi:hypothetical protein